MVSEVHALSSPLAYTPFLPMTSQGLCLLAGVLAGWGYSGMRPSLLH